MRVSKVLDPASNAVSFTLIGVVEPAERYLRYLAETEKGPGKDSPDQERQRYCFTFRTAAGPMFDTLADGVGGSAACTGDSGRRLFAADASANQ